MYDEAEPLYAIALAGRRRLLGNEHPQTLEPGAFSTAMIAGFTPAADQMHFLEPMITRETLLRQDNFTLPMPIRQTFDRDTRYPTSFQAVFKGGELHENRVSLALADFIDTNVEPVISNLMGNALAHAREPSCRQAAGQRDRRR